MAVKEWFQRFQPVQLYAVLFFTTAFFIVALVASHVTHSLTLLINAYHMLCNIIAMGGCIATIKYGNREICQEERSVSFASSQNCVTTGSVHESIKSASVRMLQVFIQESQSDRRMKNTFGWARIDILTMLVCCVFLASFSFSLLVEALQTLIHIDHMDAMHHPFAVLFIGAAGILLNCICFILIGGYTLHQSSLLQVTETGQIIMQRNQSLKPVLGDTRHHASMNRTIYFHSITLRQGVAVLCRDLMGCIFVILVSVIVIYTDSYVAKFVDPAISIVSAITLFVLSYPYMKESGMILLQTIPNHINIDSLKKELLKAFPGIVNIHDLHVWQLTGSKTISTVHIIFQDPSTYARIIEQITAFFVEMGITQVTIQPEFQKLNDAQADCLIRCRGKNCSESQCCAREEETRDTDSARIRGLIRDTESHGFEAVERYRTIDEVALNVKDTANISKPNTDPEAEISAAIEPKTEEHAVDVEPPSGIDCEVKISVQRENEQSCA